MSFGKRLAEERKRLGLKQAEFVALVGSNVAKQSLYENDKRDLRASYLARLAEAGVDVVYILTGRRGEQGQLDQAASELLTAHLALPTELQRMMEDLARALRKQFARRPGTRYSYDAAASACNCAKASAPATRLYAGKRRHAESGTA